MKFAQAKDYQGLFNALDCLIKETIPNFDNFHIIDKAYTYIAMCLYSVHNSIVTENTVLGPIELSLTVILDAIEMTYSKLKESYTLKLSDSINVELALPIKLSLSHEEINIEYTSAIKKIKDVVFETPEEKKSFVSQIDTNIAMLIEKTVKKQFGISCNLFNDVVVNLIEPEIFYLIAQIYSEKLDDYYEILYYCFEYLKWSFETYKQFTPLETRILFNQFKIDKERQAQEQAKALNS